MYPNSLLPHLYYQVFLAQVPYCSEDMETHACDSSESSEDTGIDSGSSGATEIFAACGVSTTETLTCDQDWDNDGVENDSEPQPQSLLQQIQVMQCNLAIGHEVSSEELFSESEIFDTDEMDTDDNPSYDMNRNLGGSSAYNSDQDMDYEGAYIELDLVGGNDYTFVVGANEGDDGAGQGFYELIIKKVEPAE